MLRYEPLDVVAPACLAYDGKGWRATVGEIIEPSRDIARFARADIAGLPYLDD